MNKKLKPFKIYPRVSQHISDCNKKRYTRRLGCTSSTLPELVLKFKSFYKDIYPMFFDALVKEIWLEQQLYIGGTRRVIRKGDCIENQKSFCFFMRGMVGASQKIITINPILSASISYFKDFFPNFSDHNPFEESEYFKFPYENITPDFLYIVRNHHNRLAMLDYAEKNNMTIFDFIDWAVDQSMAYNLEVGEDIYIPMIGMGGVVYLKKTK